ncbi:nucleotide exchange factor GrpE [Parahaliea sp. F7430]|uniref:Protein GrpE n=1 Tax=Sediminihaliea albiluteola TaxID=2758564 RepID=A0A7W2TYC4_9GAMM|nr:nucleotide exchange factor GrpE [Sediminihaliea albiluteola]MBA6414208.1 nucleotide exchange factor GrpE [Sediminihaliea albiluteola]
MADEKQKQPETEEELAEQQATEIPSAEAQAAAEDVGNASEQSEEELDPIARLEEEVGQLKDAALRAHADAQNAQRRAEKEVEKARKFALESFSKELLSVVDNLERALEAAGGDNEQIKPVAEGVELTLKGLMGVLRKFNIEPVDPQGEPFDPELHQAMSMVENPEVEPNTVIAVMQKGYTLNGRLIRPAMVMVSKAPA